MPPLRHRVPGGSTSRQVETPERALASDQGRTRREAGTQSHGTHAVSRAVERSLSMRDATLLKSGRLALAGLLAMGMLATTSASAVDAEPRGKDALPEHASARAVEAVARSGRPQPAPSPIPPTDLVPPPATDEADGAAPAHGLAVDVATFNIQYGTGHDGVLDLERTAAAIEATGADVIALQEVDRNWGERSGHVDQVAWLASRLEMDHAYNRDFGSVDSQRGNAVLSRHPILASTTHPFHPGGQRGVLDVRVDIDGEQLTILNAHLSSSVAAQEHEVSVIREVLGSSSTRTVLAGDFNTLVQWGTLDPLLSVLDDAWSAAPRGSKGNTYPANKPQTRIDYLMVSPDLAVETATVPASDASDHLPVVIRLY
jgi:endonuclease/exonuclease/phosphatase family metal-dependent hydrolase